MIGTSTLDHVWLMSWIIILHSIGPLCIICCILSRLLSVPFSIPKAVQCLIASEAAFYLFTYAYRNYYLQRPALHPPPPPLEDRVKLFRLCFDNSPDLAESLSKWFRGAPLASIKKQNIQEWLRWAFLHADQDDPAMADELEEYVEQLEVKLGINFEPGKADLRSIRLTLDRVDALHRSMIWYAVCCLPLCSTGLVGKIC